MAKTTRQLPHSKLWVAFSTLLTILWGHARTNCFVSVSRTRSIPGNGQGKRYQTLEMSGMRLLELVEYKKREVEQLIKDHYQDDDPLQLRLKYYTDQSQLLVGDALRRAKEPEERHMLSVICDLKRQTPTGGGAGLANFLSAGEIAKQFVEYGADAAMINSDYHGYGGDIADLETTAQALNRRRSSSGGMSFNPGAPGAAVARGAAELMAKQSGLDSMSAQQLGSGGVDGADMSNLKLPATKKKVPIIMKDLIIHPMQIALGLESGANCFHLCASLVGPALEDLLDQCTIMGTEALVEVHTEAELDYALEIGANMIMVNNWDRLEGKLHRNQALGLMQKIPPPIISIAAGGIMTPDQCFALQDAGYDGVVLGRALSDSADIKKLIQTVRKREGVERRFLGWGLNGDQFSGDDIGEEWN